MIEHRYACFLICKITTSQRWAVARITGETQAKLSEMLATAILSLCGDPKTVGVSSEIVFDSKW